MRSPAISGGMAAVALAGAVVVTTAPVAEAQTVRVPCNLRALVDAINHANVAGTSTLRLSARCRYNITTPATGSVGLPVITGNVRIVGGPRTTIQRDPAVAEAFRIFDVASGARLTLTGLAILNGRTAGLGGGIQNTGTLALNRVSMSGNAASSGGALAILPGGTATISLSALTENTTSGVGGGAIINFGTLNLVTSLVNRNSAPVNGGGLNNQPGGVSNITRSSFSANRSGSIGGGISNLGTVRLNRTLVRRNQGSDGGGIGTGNANVTLINSIVRNNIPNNCSPLNTIPRCVD